jgi:hypothetical protein
MQAYVVFMQRPPTEDDLSPQKRQILLYMWKSGAVGDRAIRLRNLKARLSDDVRSNYVSNMKDLESRLFVRISRADHEESASLTPLGLAYIRQVQDDNLRFITGDRLDNR